MVYLKKNPFVLFFLLYLLPGCQQKEEYDFFRYYKNYGGRHEIEFLAYYPFEEYLKKYQVTDLKTIEEHRQFLESNKRIGDAFLCKAFEFYALEQEKNKAVERAVNLIEVGENCLNVPITPGTHQFEIYHVVGYFLLGRAAQTLEKKKSRFSDVSYKSLRHKLEMRRILLSVEESFWTKLTTRSLGQNLKRLWQGLFSSDEYHKISLHPANFQASVMPEIQIYNIFEDQNLVGNCIWMNRNSVVCKYLADRDLVAKYTNIRQNIGILLAASGGFTNDLRQPEGLTIQNGQIINAVLMPDRDALVIVENNGGLRTCNIKKGFILPHTARTINPLYSLSDYIELVHWCRNNKATVFQTQLLALGDELLIDPEKAHPELRERRFLVTVSSVSGEVEHIIFNFTSGKNLAIATIETFEALQKRRKKVEAILNLDVGNFNVLEVYDTNGKPVPDVRGTKDIATATNLLVYMKKN